MLDPAQLAQIQQTLATHKGPTLSLYLEVNPGKPENARETLALRAKDAMKGLEVPPAVRQRVLAYLSTYNPDGRTLALFAGEDFLEGYTLPVEVPLQGVEAQWGAPDLTPLLITLDEHPRAGVVCLDREHLQYFEVVLGQIQEVEDAFRGLPTEEWRTLGEDAVGGSGGRSAGPGATGNLGRAAGGSGKDLFNHRVGAWTHRFFLRVGELLDKRVAEQGIERLILIGVPEEAVQAFPARVQQAIAQKLPALGVSRPTPAQVLQAVQDALQQAERRGEAALLAQVRERGITGVDAVLEALQEGRLHYVLVPLDLEVPAWRCANGRVGLSPKALKGFCDGQEVRPVSLRAVLPELAAANRTRLEFVGGDSATALNVELGGLGGLPRW
ncbi:MAG: hypothetical protein K6T57_08765 [Thermaceae bacterium]|nr:hypothetical protein [Thermaceae bacterium]